MLIKSVKRGICGALLTATLLGASIPAVQFALQPTVAHAIRPTSDGNYPKWNPKDPAGWSQNPDGDGSHLPPDKKKGKAGVMFDGSGRFPYDSCMIYSLTFVYLKAGVVEIGVGPGDVHDMIYESMKSFGWTDYDLLTDADMGGKLEVVSEKGSFYNNPTSSAKIKELWEQGYLLILDVPIGTSGLHAIAVDKIEGDDIYILDSGNWGLKLSDYYGNESVVGYTAFKMKDGTKAKDLPVLQEHPDGNLNGAKASAPERALTNEQKNYVGGGGVWNPNENDIPNMPTYREYLELKNQGKASSSANYKDFVEKLNGEQVKEDFKEGSEGAMSITKWKEEREVNLAKQAVDDIRMANMLVGIILAVSTAPLVLIYWFDRFNPFGVSLLHMLSGGRLRVMNGREYEEYKKFSKESKPFRALNDVNIFVYIAIISLVVAFIISGQMYAWVSVLVNWLQQLWGYVSNGWFQ